MRITGVEEKLSYSVTGYKTKKDFEDSCHSLIADELPFKRDARKLGKEKLLEFYKVKIYDNRGWSEILEVTTKVIFKKLQGEVVAIFPEECGTSDPYTCLSYMHIGQHSPFSVDLIGELKAAKPEEYADLKKELEGIGYNLEVIKKNQSTFLKVRQEQLRRFR